jgi:hypothetical protein
VHPRTAILIAAALVYVIGAYVPFGREALYPLTLFTTWVHEMGHGLTALVLGGRFTELAIFKNASGWAAAYAEPGWRDAFVALGGLLAPPIVGSALIAGVHGPKRARWALGILAGAIVLSLVIYVRSATGVIAMPVVAALLGWAAWRAEPEHRIVLVQLLGVVLALDTLTRMVSYVFENEVVVDGVKHPSDISNVATNLGGSYVLWGMLVTLLALGMIALAGWWTWRRPAGSASPAA